MMVSADSQSRFDAALVAAERGEEEAVLAWLEGGGRADATYERGGVSGLTLLMGAAGNGHERVVELLLQRGAEINKQDSDGWTALMYAADNGHERAVESCRCCCSAARMSTSRPATASPCTTATSGRSSCCCSAARRSTCRTATAGPR